MVWMRATRTIRSSKQSHGSPAHPGLWTLMGRGMSGVLAGRHGKIFMTYHL
jgi:hypothetical protein